MCSLQAASECSARKSRESIMDSMQSDKKWRNYCCSSPKLIQNIPHDKELSTYSTRSWCSMGLLVTAPEQARNLLHHKTLAASGDICASCIVFAECICHSNIPGNPLTILLLAI